MGKFCINWMFPYTDSIVKTDSKGRCTEKPFVVYLNGLESIGQALMLQEYTEL